MFWFWQMSFWLLFFVVSSPLQGETLSIIRKFWWYYHGMEDWFWKRRGQFLLSSVFTLPSLHRLFYNSVNDFHLQYPMTRTGCNFIFWEMFLRCLEDWLKWLTAILFVFLSALQWTRALQLPVMHKKGVTCLAGRMVSDTVSIFASTSSDGTVVIWKMEDEPTSVGKITDT